MNIDLFYQENPVAKEILQKALNEAQITSVEPLSVGSTNRSYLIRTTGKSYVLRVPGADSNNYIDRNQEKAVYDLINGKAVTDPVVLLDPETGCKVSEYYEHARPLDVSREKDMELFVRTVHHLHDLKLKCRQVYHFDANIRAYEKNSLTPGWFEDYAQTREQVLELQKAMENHEDEYVLIHNDLSPENCLIVSEVMEEDKCVLIDFEYAAMQSPMADIAYFCVFANLNEEETDRLIERYFDHQFPPGRRAEVYAYIALNGFLHCNWLGTRSEERRAEAQAAYTMTKRYIQKTKQVLR